MKKWMIVFVILNFLAIEKIYAEDTLRILSWSSFFSPEVISEFEKKHNVRIEIVPYYSSDMRDFIIKNKNRQKIDIIVSGQSGIIDYINLDLIQPLQIDKLPNYKNMDLKLVKNKEVRNHSVNISYGFMGIAYRNDKKITAPTSWADFINPYDEVKGRIDMIADPNDALDIFLIGMGVGLDNYNMEDLISAGKKFSSFQENLYSYDYNSNDPESNIVTGKSWITPLYGFEAYDLITEKSNISFVYPKEGVKIWRDYVSVVKNDNSSDLSFDFINFIMNPKNAAKNTEHNYYASLNKKANEIINPDILNNPFIYKKNNVKTISDEVNEEKMISKKHYLYYRILENFKGDQ
jgi:spermidine/putrescine transport system substrate-binding protein